MIYRLRSLLTLLVIIPFVYSGHANSQPVRMVSFEEMEPSLYTLSDTTVLVNFWATFCAPCVEELPAIERTARELAGEKYKIILVSLDFPKQLDSRLRPFIREHGLQSTVFLLNAPDANRWIPRVNESWTGSIPATLIFNRKGRWFYERSFTYDELITLVKQKLINE